MNKEGFSEYLYSHFSKPSGTINSYLKAISILDKLFTKSDKYELKGKSLFSLDNLDLLIDISDFVKLEESNFKINQAGIFTLGESGQSSYPKGGFCSAAMKQLINYYSSCKNIEAESVVNNSTSAEILSQQLNTLFDVNNPFGTETVREKKERIGQNFFRKMLLDNYHNKCSVTGLDVTQVLRASHIVAWADDVQNRMNPENGILLSATYDAAFDQHLISFDENYKLIVSKQIKDFYSSEAANDYFIKKEGLKMSLPSKYLPSQILLQKHREKMVG